tara:strand:- start:271 stop:690 length:420 start_codon:yes stop_codon:yes gene_type:complete
MDLNLLIVVFLVLSLSLNILLIWFLRGLTSRLVLVSENMSGLLDHLMGYGSDLKSVSEMELYYGDETMQGLVKHTQMMLEVLSDFEEIYALTDDENIGDEEKQNEEIEEEALDGDETKSPEDNASTTQVQRKAVFYSGP